VPVGEKFVKYGEEVLAELRAAGLRVELDASAESFNKRVRAAITNKTPNIFILGGREEETRGVTWRRYGREEQLSMSLADAASKLSQLHRERLLDTANQPDLVK
jgi:threonyl-tRNA synthetase